MQVEKNKPTDPDIISTLWSLATSLSRLSLHTLEFITQISTTSLLPPAPTHFAEHQVEKTEEPGDLLICN